VLKDAKVIILTMKEAVMKGKHLILIGAVGVFLAGCSNTKMVQLDQFEPQKEMEVPKFALKKHDPNVGVGYAKSSDYGEALAYAHHQASGDICKKSNIEVRSNTTTTSAHNSKGAQSQTALTGRSITESKCKTLIGDIEPDEIVVKQEKKRLMFHAWVLIKADSVSGIVDNNFTNADQELANTLKVD
jgi:hypothetical protein